MRGNYVLCLCLLLVSSAATGSQKVNSCIYLGDTWRGDQWYREKTFTTNKVTFSDYGIAPTNATVSQGSKRTFTAYPPQGWKVTSWLTAKQPGDIQPNALVYGKYKKTVTSLPTFEWSYDVDYGDVDTCAVAVRFDPFVYTNRFEAGEGADGKPSEKEHTYVDYYKLESLEGRKFSKKGHSFKCWQVDQLSNLVDRAVITSGSNFNVRADGQVVKFTAVWTANVYRVTFDANGGSTPSPASKMVTYGKNYDVLPVVTNPGYEFMGWYDPSSNRIETTTLLSLTNDHTLTACWMPSTYTVGFNVVGNGSGTVEPSSVDMAYGSQVTVTATPSEGSEFTRWSDGVTTNPRTLTVESNATYTATFSLKRYQVTFNWLIGNAVPTQEVRAVNWGETAQAPASDAVNSRIGYRWQRWDAAISSVKSNMTVNAIYEANRYRVVFDGNGAEEGGMLPQQFVYDVPQALSPNGFSRDAALWQFDGWEDVSTQATYADGATVSNLTAVHDGEVVLKAKWTSLLNSISKAVKCTNLLWDVDPAYPGWGLSERTDCLEGTCVTNSQPGGTLVTEIGKPGTLKLRWRGSASQPKLGVVVDTSEYAPLTAVSEEWTEATIVLDDKSLGQLQIYSKTAGEYVIDWIKWMPDGSRPEPEEKDRPTMDGMVITVNGLGVRIGNVSGNFDYQLLATNDLTAPMPWPVIKEAAGESTEPILFVVPETEGQPQMFYRARVIQKKEL